MTGRRILVVEDDARVRDAYVDILGNHGHTVLAVDDGADGLAEIARTPPDVIVLDLLMPRAKVDGLEFLSRLAGGAAAHTPIVILSALGEMMAREVSAPLATALCIAAILGKPVVRDTLLREIDRGLGAKMFL
jgi:CheY-like chemotaxis protein